MSGAQVVRWGNSLAVRIPKAVAEQACVKEGDPIQIRASKHRIELVSEPRMPSLKALVAAITPENRYQEADWGTDQGKEIVEW